MRALGLCVLLACSLRTAPHIEPLGPRPECGEPYAQHVERAQRAEQEGDLRCAAEAYSEVLADSCFEVPNYEATLHLARALCAAGEPRLGLEIVADFQCMLDVDSGNAHCYVDNAASAPNAALTNRCFEEMCGELYLPYYESPSPQRLDWIRARRREATDVLAYCRSRQ